MEIGASMAPRRQASSHGAAQTRPQTEANGFGARATRKASSGAAVGDELDVAAGVGRDRAAGLALDLRLPVLEIGEPDANAQPCLASAEVSVRRRRTGMTIVMLGVLRSPGQ